MRGGMKKGNGHKLKNKWIPTYKGISIFFLPLGQPSVRTGCPEIAQSSSSEIFRTWSDLIADRALGRNLER